MIIQEYHDAMEKIKKSTIAQKTIEKEYHKKTNKIKDEFYTLKNELEIKFQEKLNEAKKENNNIINEITASENTSLKIIDEYKKLMTFFHIIDTKPVPQNFSVSLKEEIYKPIDTLCDDQFKKIQIFITKNYKPKNKWDLIIVGSTIFNEKVLIIPRDYRIRAHLEDANIHYIIKSGSKKELKKYFNKNKDKIIKEVLAPFEVVEQKYTETLELFQQKKWKIALLEYLKNYWENEYYQGTKTKQYKQILKRLKELNS